MPWQWISRIFSRKQLHGLHNQNQPNDHTSSSAISENQHELKDSNASPINILQQELESAFYCWLLDCTAAELQMDSDSLEQKTKVILKGLDQDALSVDRLPRRPASFPLLIKLLNSDNASNTEIANTLLSDPALATQTLKTANTPFFRTSHEAIETVERAVFILGSQGIRNIISATVMMPMIKGSDSKQAIFSKKVWHWGLMSATASDQYSHLQGNDAGPIYLLGLLPSLAYLLIYQSLQAYLLSQPSIDTLEPAVIKSVIQQRGWQLCHDICQQWGLPPTCNKYLLDAERPSRSNDNMPLRDGICIGTHKALKTYSTSPIDDSQVVLLSNSDEAVIRKVLHLLDERVKG